ncbi:uncharacterized protein LOC120479430 [Pimephales promelas]|uniref:uncharacterized protein LOC120479430 n=1 Tax=Pimephales promelas TaxID=90988 RepID=UPI001955D391|nr:uncharacterized protein LOC120479430 [Pimephales promelas]
MQSSEETVCASLDNPIHGYEDVTPWSTLGADSEHSDTSPDTRTNASATEPSRKQLRRPSSGKGVKRLRETYGEYDSNNDLRLAYPDNEENSVGGIKRLRETYGEYDSNNGLRLAYPDSEENSVGGIKRLRETYGEYAPDNGLRLAYPDSEENPTDERTSNTKYEETECTAGSYKKRLSASRDCEVTPNASSSEDSEPDYPERDLEIFLESQADVLDAVGSQDSSPSTHSDEDTHDPFRPLFTPQDFHRLSYDTFRSANRNFLRVLDVASRPLTYQETEDLLVVSQAPVVALQRRIIELQNQHAGQLSNTVEFFGNCHEQTQTENRRLWGVVDQVRGDQQILTLAVTLISERLNIIQRILRDLPETLRRR